MKLVKIILENFRGFQNRTEITIDLFTAIIGKNDAGKSTILEALDIFFENSKMEQADASIVGNKSKVRIGCVFSDFPKTLILDKSNQTTLEGEHLLNQDSLLEIHKIYDCTKSKCDHEPYVIANFPSNSECRDVLTLNNTRLKAKAKEIGVDKSIDLTKNAEIRSAIIKAKANGEFSIQEIALDSDGGKSIWSTLEDYLPTYALFKSDRSSTDQDDEAQNPLKAAVKEAIGQHQERLKELTTEINAQVQEVANRTVEKIAEISPELAKSLTPTIKNKNWDSLFSIGLTDENEIPVNKRGSGVRRLILLSFFRAKVEMDLRENNKSSVIYAIEEPETSQHPSNQRIIINTLQELSEKPGCQVILTTHTPVLTRQIDNSQIRYLKKEGGYPIVHLTSDEINKDIAASLGILPDHSIKCFIGVEGKHDINFLKAITPKLHAHSNEYPDLAKAEGEGKIVFIPLGGSNLELWVSRINGLGRPQFYIFDRDTTPPTRPKYQTQYDDFIEQGHNCIITTKKELENYLHHSVISSAIAGYLGDGSAYEDVPMLAAQAAYSIAPDSGEWVDVLADREKLGKKKSAIKHKLNSELAKKMTAHQFLETDADNVLSNWLKEIRNVIDS